MKNEEEILRDSVIKPCPKCGEEMITEFDREIGAVFSECLNCGNVISDDPKVAIINMTFSVDEVEGR